MTTHLFLAGAWRPDPSVRVTLSVQVTLIDGLERRSRGSIEVQTLQSQPSVGTPIEVPLPRMWIVACKRYFLGPGL
ncbi:MAG TPA: hypothetical protein VGD64_08305 [Acidisarcina sp.]